MRGALVRLLVRIILVTLAVLVGWRVGPDVGLLFGVAWDQATGNDFVSSALLAIPLGGLIGILAMLFIGLRLTRCR